MRVRGERDGAPAGDAPHTVVRTRVAVYLIAVHRIGLLHCMKPRPRGDDTAPSASRRSHGHAAPAAGEAAAAPPAGRPCRGDPGSGRAPPARGDPHGDLARARGTAELDPGPGERSV